MRAAIISSPRPFQGGGWKESRLAHQFKKIVRPSFVKLQLLQEAYCGKGLRAFNNISKDWLKKAEVFRGETRSLVLDS